MIEKPILFGRHGSLMGVLTEPEVSRGVPVVILNAGIIHRVGPSRLSVEVARVLAAAGHRVLRFDLSGIGDTPLPREGAESSLAELVRGDIRSALEVVAGPRGPAVLLGLCAGADSAFVVAAEDERVVGLVLLDPLVHETPGFRRRRALRRLRNPRAWWNLVSGRSLILRLRKWADEAVLPPEHYGLLRAGPEDAPRMAHRMADRGVRFLFVLTGGVRSYCNHPEQVREALPGVFRGAGDPRLVVEWRPTADHIFSRSVDRGWLGERVSAWLRSVGAPPPDPDGVGAESPPSTVASKGVDA